MNEMIKVTVNGTTYEKKSPLFLEDFAEELGLNDVYCATVNNRLHELTYFLNRDADVNFLDLTNTEAMNTYSTSLRYVFTMAIKNLFPQARVIINFGISRSFYIEIEGIALNTITVRKIENEINEIIQKDLLIRRMQAMSKEDAMAIYQKLGYQDKVELLKYRPENSVHLYECNGYTNYMGGYMVPSTGYLKEYKIRLYGKGLILQYPRSECGGIIPAFEDAPTFSKALSEARFWGNLCGASYIAKMNQSVEQLKELEFINMCEAKHNDMLAELGVNISSNIKNIRLIAVAGPSSSGKTTFTNRLRIELKARGIEPLMISLDNYYLNKDQAPKDEDGNPDLEHLQALDVDLFNEQMVALINGEEVTLPIFNFETGSREAGETVKLGPNNPVLIEGIHALNDDLTPSIPNYQKYKIYIAPQAQLHLDDQNPISITDMRLIRRLVRDKKFRNAKAEETLSMWPSVRRGEFRWIYDGQEGVDYVYNSELSYELCVLKKYALPMLEEIDKESPYYIQANRLVKFLKYFKDIEDTWIPCNSILREFIGGSSFYRK